MTSLNEKRCAYCGSDEARPWLSGIRDRLECAPGEWSFVRCTRCGSGLLRPVPSQEALVSYYPEVYSFSPVTEKAGWLRRWWSRLESVLIYGRMYRRDACRVAARTAGKEARGKVLLDVGCGRGLRLLAFHRLGYEVHGWDVQPHVVEYVRRELGLRADHGDLEQLGSFFPAESFHTVTAFYVLEHVLDVERLLRACARLLKPGGWFVGAVPLADSSQALLFGSRWSQATEAPRHVTLPTQNGLTCLLRRVGFQNVTWIPDTSSNCSGAFALSVIPSSSTPALYGARRVRAFVSRLLGIGVAMLAAPWAWVENRVLARPCLGVVFAQKPLAPAREIEETIAP